MKKAVIIIVSVLVILAGTFTCLYFFTDLFSFMKPASNNFALQAKKLFGAKTESSYSNYLASIENLKGKNESYKADAEVSMNVTLPNSVLDYSTQKMINNSSLKWSGSYDANTKAQANNIGLSYNNKELVNLNAIVDGKKIYVNSKDIYDKGLTFDLDKFVEFCKKNNIDIDENKAKESMKSFDSFQSIDASSLLYDLFYLTEDEYKALDKNYGDMLSKFIDKNNFTSKKNQTVTVGSKDNVKTTAYSLTISGNDIYDFFTNLTKTAKDDNTLKDLVVKKYDILKKFIETSTSTMDDSPEFPELKSSDINEIFNSILKDLENSKESFSDIKQSLKLTIYSDKKNNPVKFEIAILKNKEDDGTVIFTDELEKGKNTYTIDVKALTKVFGNSSADDEDNYSSYLSSSKKSSISSLADSISKIVLVDEYESSKESRKGKITVTAKTSSGSQDVLTIEYDKVSSKSELKNNIKVSSPLVAAVSFELKFEVTGLDSNKQNLVFNMSANVPISYASYKFDVKASGSIEYGNANVSTPSGAVNVFDKSVDELQPIVDEIFENASNSLPGKLSNYGLKITKDQILAAKPTLKAESIVDVVGPSTDEGSIEPAA